MWLAYRLPVVLSILQAIIFKREVFPAPEAPKMAEIYPALNTPLTLLRIVLTVVYPAKDPLAFNI